MSEIVLPFNERNFDDDLKRELGSYKAKISGNKSVIASFSDEMKKEADEELKDVKFYVLDYAGGKALKSNSDRVPTANAAYERTAKFKCVLAGRECYLTPTGGVFGLLARCHGYRDKLDELKKELTSSTNVNKYRIPVVPDADTKYYAYFRSRFVRGNSGPLIGDLKQLFDGIFIPS